MHHTNPLLHALNLKENLRKVLKARFKAKGITEQELAKRCLELTKRHD